MTTPNEPTGPTGPTSPDDQTTPTDAPPPRSLADDLRARDDEALSALLEARADLVTPVPGDMTALATRATSPASVGRALDRLDAGCLQVVEVLCTLPEPTTPAQVAERWGADPTRALALLRDLGLLWGAPDELHLVRAVRATTRDPAGLGAPVQTLLAGASPEGVARVVRALGRKPTGDVTKDAAIVAAKLASARTVERLLAGAPEGARDALQRLVWGPPSGAVSDARRTVDPESARTPVDWLLAHGLLVPTGADTVTLPQEVALVLRGGRVHAEPAPAPPPLDEVRRGALPGRAGAQAHARAGAEAAAELVRRTEDLLEAWGVEPPQVLRQGGLAVRELRRAGQALDLDDQAAALVIEVAHAAGLLATGAEGDEWLPTPAYDAWASLPVAERWVPLAAAWLATTRVASLVGERDDRDKPLNALGPGLDRSAAPELRLAVLGALAELPPGAGATPESLLARLTWHRPRRTPRTRDQLVRTALLEAEQVGLTGQGALTPHGRVLVAGLDDDAAETLAPMLPQPVEEVLLQADLTAVAPGPLVPALARELALAADVESTGGATVYRFTPASVRRALDAGRSAEDLHALFRQHSRTPVPQPLTYLVDDVARRYGRVRVGVASSYVRCDDPSVLEEVLADRRAAQLRLRRLAPTVLAAQSPVDVVLERLRAIGLSPAAESPEGEVVVRRPDSRRAPARPRPPRLVSDVLTPPPATLRAAVRALRAGDRVAVAVASRREQQSSASRLPRTTSAEAVPLLREALREGTPLVIGYVNAEASATERVVEPMSFEGGFLTAYDHLTESVRTFSVARITGVAPVASDG
ncbi:XPB/Ssl2-like helicase family protein [Motilibacter rhizosphaerae]|uniref:XPB/Ssl2-like helicase family protein n=1 Tax=Motilibacter rhizosphaerae TaxID=598652 RepID=A0A4Q7NR74_9ACTN|nr:helicase-associated domain-containing protein [Motilibacter rhizosphaerae]RZS87536.1 XPB/Ssl2-like helicase family protein [Motilibacter rhizosphaerae]